MYVLYFTSLKSVDEQSVLSNFQVVLIWKEVADQTTHDETCTFA